MLTAKELREQASELNGRVTAIQELAKEEDREFNAEEIAEIDRLHGTGTKGEDGFKEGEIDVLVGKADYMDRLEAKQADLAKPRTDIQVVKTEVTSTGKSYYQSGKLRAFTGDNAKQDAVRSGLWAAAAIFGHGWAKERCESMGIPLIKGAQSEADDAKGGHVVPNEMSSAIIDLRETYGVFRRNTRSVMMGSDTLTIPRRVSGTTDAFFGENTEITASDKTWDNVKLVAQKLASLTRYSTELAEDAIISIADDLAFEFAWGFSLKEDQAGFIGDGTSTYGGIHGAAVKVNDGNHAASISTAASGNTAFSTLDLADFHSLVGILPQYALPNARFFISQAGYSDSMARLAYAGGGNTVDNISGTMQLSFLGYPVEISQVMNSTLAADTAAIKLLFGDLRLASTMGERRGITVTTSADRYFELDQLAIKATERIDIVVHDLGDGSTAGPLVALKTPAS